jgi:hypothetical protein
MSLSSSETSAPLNESDTIAAIRQVVNEGPVIIHATRRTKIDPDLFRAAGDRGLKFLQLLETEDATGTVKAMRHLLKGKALTFVNFFVNLDVKRKPKDFENTKGTKDNNIKAAVARGDRVAQLIKDCCI